jgi:hypothetical protein
MELNQEQKTLEVKSKKNYPMAVFSVIWLILFCLKFKSLNDNFLEFNFNATVFCIGIYILTLYFIYQLIWTLFGVTVFIISDKTLTVKSGISFIKRTKIFFIDQIFNVKIKSNVDSSTTWGFQGIRFSDYKSTVLSFNYRKQEIILGANLSTFDIDKLRKWITPN